MPSLNVAISIGKLIILATVTVMVTVAGIVTVIVATLLLQTNKIWKRLTSNV
jgi:hypothetical protein